MQGIPPKRPRFVVSGIHEVMTFGCVARDFDSWLTSDTSVAYGSFSTLELFDQNSWSDFERLNENIEQLTHNLSGYSCNSTRRNALVFWQYSKY